MSKLQIAPEIPRAAECVKHPNLIYITVVKPKEAYKPNTEASFMLSSTGVLEYGREERRAIVIGIAGFERAVEKGCLCVSGETVSIHPVTRTENKANAIVPKHGHQSRSIARRTSWTYDLTFTGTNIV